MLCHSYVFMYLQTRWYSCLNKSCVFKMHLVPIGKGRNKQSKRITIPCLELLAVLIGIRFVTRELRLGTSEKYFNWFLMYNALVKDRKNLFLGFRMIVHFGQLGICLGILGQAWTETKRSNLLIKLSNVLRVVKQNDEALLYGI